jgi:hypothetical protein
VVAHCCRCGGSLVSMCWLTVVDAVAHWCGCGGFIGVDVVDHCVDVVALWCEDVVAFWFGCGGSLVWMRWLIGVDVGAH